MSEFVIERLSANHNRNDFDCGDSSLNNYLQRYARQSVDNDSARVYVTVTELGTAKICGYFTLGAGQVDALAFPNRVRKGWPRDVPTILVGRLAVDLNFQNQGLGTDLIYGVFNVVESVSERIGVAAIDVWALNERARTFYRKLGFAELQDDPFHLYLATATVRASLQN